jgi:formamidopyrimidine-DNA glycosylase
MPELPEVEIASRNLRRWLGGKTISAAKLESSRILRGAPPASFSRLLAKRRVAAITRRGKWIRVDLSGGAALFSHLGMTGKWVKRAPGDGPQRFERARLDAGRVSVRYVDPRMFGRLVAAPRGEPIPEWTLLGPDPLTDGLDAAALHAVLQRTKRSVKEVLMDQAVIAGVGNIQAAEALHRARIHPARPAASLTLAEVRAIVRGIDATIAFTLGLEDGPEITYVEEPGADNPFRVYGKAGEPCPREKTPIARMVQGGRSTFFCPRCQPFR